MMDNEDSQSLKRSGSVETDCSPQKVPKLKKVRGSLDEITFDETYASSLLFYTDPLPDSDLQCVIGGQSVTPGSSASITAKPEISVSSKENAVEFDEVVPDQDLDKLSEPEPNCSHSDFYESTSQRTIQNDGTGAPEQETQASGNARTNDGHLSPTSAINVCVLNEIFEVLDKNQTKTSEMIVQEYVSCPQRCLRVKDFLSQDIHEFLKSSKEDEANTVGSAHLKSTMEKAECSTIIKLLSDAFKKNETKLASEANGSTNFCVANVICGPAPIPITSDNVQISNTADDNITMEDDPRSDEEIDIPNANVPCSSSSSQPPNVFNVGTATYWQDKITDMLFRSLHAESCLLRRAEQKVAKMGKRLFSTLFSEEEILGGFARAKKNIPAYDETRVFEISQIINFLLNQTDDCSLENFRSSQHQNKGLDGENLETFWKTVIVKYASDERKRIKVEQS